MGGYGPDWLVLHIQPDEGISLQFDVKRPGQRVALAPVRMAFRYRDWFPKEYSVGYERLLHDCMCGEAGLFQDAAMVDAAWRIVQPVLESWAALDGRVWRTLTPGRRPPPHRAAPERRGAGRTTRGRRA